MTIAMVPSARRGRRWTEVLALLVCLSASAGAAYSPEPERFTAFAVSMTNGAAGRNSNLELVIDRWSTPADRDDLAAALDEQGPEGLLKRLQGRPRIGYVRAAGRLGNDIPFARQVQHSDGSRRIVIVLARRLSFNEVNPSSTTEDYPFTVIELRLDAAGGGDGRMSVGAKITVHTGSDQIEHEDYTGGNVLLKDVKVS
jgi:hypothetical protein